MSGLPYPSATPTIAPLKMDENGIYLCDIIVLLNSVQCFGRCKLSNHPGFIPADLLLHAEETVNFGRNRTISVFSQEMAMQTGIGVSKLLVLVGAGLTGSVILRNGRLGDILSEIQSMIKRVDEGRESPNGISDHSAALAAQVRRLAQELKHISASRSITVVNGNSGQGGNLTSLAVPITAVGAIGYAYMWWKGISFSDLMYVTKRNVANVVASVTKQLEQVSESLAATKRHLTQRIENLDGKMDEQKDLSKLIKNEVVDVREDLSQIGLDIEEIQRMVCGLEGKIGTLEEKQDFANAGVWYLCQFVGGAKDGRMAEFLQNLPAKASTKRLPAAFTEAKSLKGLQYIADTIQSGTIERKNMNAVLQNEVDGPLSEPTKQEQLK